MQYNTQSLGKKTAKRAERHQGQLPPYQLQFMINILKDNEILTAHNEMKQM